MKVVPGRLDTGHGPPVSTGRRNGIGGHSETEPGSSSEAASRYEPLDVPPLVPVWLGLLIGAFVIVVLIGITIGFPLADRQQSRGPLQTLPPTPRLDSAPVADLQRYEAAKQQELAPVQAAMRATAQQGWGPPK